MSDDQTIERLIGVLVSPPVPKMNFSALGASISSSDIYAVHSAIVNGVIVIDTPKVGVRAGGEIAYHQSGNFFSFPSRTYGASNAEKMAMIRECIHAAADVKNVWLEFYFDWEVIAHVCGAIFYRSTTQGGPPASWKRLYHAADAIGQKVMLNPGKAVDSREAWNLRTLIQTDPAYAGVPIGELSGSDGVYGNSKDSDLTVREVYRFVRKHI